MTISSRDRSSHALLAICAALSALFSLAMLHRWEVSPLGIKSYGRVWFYYVSYTDFGFTRRALVGTLLTISRVNQLVTNPYVFAYIVHSIAIAVLVALLVGVFVRNQSRAHPLLLLVTFFSPVLVIQSGYNTGSLDIYLLIVMVLCLFYARSTAVFTAGLVVGSLVHELFVFTIPSLLLIRMIEVQQNGADKSRAIRQLLVPAVAVAATVFCLRMWGTVSLPMQTYQAMVAAKIPAAAYQHPFWSGWYEVAGTLSDHMKYGRDLPTNMVANPFWVLMLVYLGILVALQFIQARGEAIHRLLALSTLTPLLVCAIAGDFYRWVGMSCSLALLSLLWLVLHEGEKFPRTAYYWLLPFSLLAPFGTADPAMPFPLIQFVLQRIGG
jgi:hypothetical protein